MREQTVPQPCLPATAPRPNSNLVAKILCLAAMTALVTTAAAVNVVNDTWKDATRTDPASPTYSENGTDADADLDLESAWYRSGTGSSTVMSTNHMVHAAGAASSMSLTTYFKPSAQTIQLNSVGDSMKITWIFKPTGLTTTATGNNDMRLAIVASPTRLAADGTPANAIYTGYGIAMNMRTVTLGNNSPFRMMEWAVAGGANNLLSTAAAWTQVATATYVAGTTPGYTEGNTYTLEWQITRTSGGADINQKITDSGGTLGTNGVLEVSYSDATPQTLAFDTFALRPSTPEVTATNFDTTLFRVEYIPGGCSPTSYTVSGSTNVCPGGTGPVALSGSDINVDYQLRLAGSPVGAPVAGTGVALNFGLQGAGNYTVYASNTTIACEGLMTGNALIAEYANPIVTVDPSPALATNGVGGTRVFTVTATGSSRSFQWRKDGINLVNGGNIAGATTNTLTLSSLIIGSSGAYDCIVSNTICSSAATSAAANLTVLPIFGPLFRTIASGNWSDLLTWELSTNGTTWFPATEAPSTLSSNITLRTGHTVVNASDLAVDDVVIESGSTLSVQGGNLTINNAAAAIDFDVAGTLQVDAGAGAITVGGSLQFQNGGQFNWNRTAAPAIPAATWQDGSTCRISATTLGSAATATGISGQSYYDFVFDATAAGHNNRCRLDLQGTATTIRRDFSITIPDTASASVTINNSTGGILTVGRHVTFVTGSTVTSTKVLLNSAAGNSYTFKVGGNFSASGVLDGFGSSSTLIEFTGASQSLTLPLGGNLITRSAMDWTVKPGSTLSLGSQIDGFNTFTNQGTLTFSNNIIAGGTTLVFESAGLVNGNSTNQLTSTNLNTIVAGGTLNLPGLPAFVGGESFLLFGAATHSGTFAGITPAIPGAGQTWDTTQLGSAGILAVLVSGGGPATNPTNIVSSVGGGNLTLSWPSDHLGWTLQTQTNSRNVGLVPATNAWFNVAGSAALTNIVIPIGSANPTVFYRLMLFIP